MGSRRRGLAESQKGYALLIVIGLVAMLAVSVALAERNILYQGRREKELEMIWRGKQYARAIGLYYRKTHHFPTELDDLYKPKMGIRFLRQAYRDPMNAADGSWRLIYVGPSGQLVGSLNQPPPLFPTNVSNPNPATSFEIGPLTAPAVSSKDPLGSLTSPTNASSFGAPPGPNGSAATPSNPANSALSPGSTGDSANAQPALSGSALQSLGAVDSSQAFNSNPIIGVGSKIKKPSIIWMDGAKDYLHFEFIYKAVTPDPRTVTPNP